MAQSEFKLPNTVLTAILNSPDTELKEIFLEGFKLLRFDPLILDRIAKDINRTAKEKKAMRLTDQAWYSQLSGTFPGFESLCKVEDFDPETLCLLEGRPRLMDPESIFFLMMCRGHLDSVTSKQAADRLKDSALIRNYFEARSMKVPAPNTIFDNINAVTNDTRDYIYESQMRMIMESGLDTMNHVAMDSFSVSGNTEWPTDSRMLLKFLQRAYHIGHAVLKNFGLPGFTKAYIPKWLKKMKKLEFELENTCGKPNSKKKVKRLYRDYLKHVNKILLRLIRRIDECISEWEDIDHLPPSRQVMVQAAIDRLVFDIESVIHIYTYTENRVFHGIQLPAPEKILSLSDECAAFIKKGGREAVIGYKPQVVRSGEGFITAFELQEGNPSDSKRLQPLINQHCKNTHSVPDTVAVDDGYSSRKNRKALKNMGIKTVAISGSKGKNITPASEWNSPEHQDARKSRSAVESIIFVLRYKFHLDSFTRRELKGVTAELTEKVIVHNFWRISYLRRKIRKLKAKAA